VLVKPLVEDDLLAVIHAEMEQTSE
jgi:hypothetical protein